MGVMLLRGLRVCVLAMERVFLVWGEVWTRRGGTGGVSSGVCVSRLDLVPTSLNRLEGG